MQKTLMWLKHLINERRLKRRVRQLQKTEVCPGCGQRGPWLAVFIHPLCPPHMRGEDGTECQYCEDMPAQIKIARLMMLATLGIPLHPDIIENVNKCLVESMDDGAVALVHELHDMMVAAEGPDFAEQYRNRNNPSEADGELPLGGTTDGWREWDMDN